MIETLAESFLARPEWWSAVASILTLIVVFVYTLLTARMTRAAERSVEAQYVPSVIVYAQPVESSRTLFELVIENIGRGAAYDVKFQMSRPLPWRAWGISTEKAPMPGPMTQGPLIAGIPALGPGSKRTLLWGQWGGLKKSLGDKPVQVTATFQGADRKECGPTFNPIEIDSHDGLALTDTDGTRQCAIQLRRVADQLERDARGRQDLCNEPEQDEFVKEWD
jgi:hypothetical protein